MSYRSLLAVALLALAGCRPMTRAADLPPTRPAPPPGSARVATPPGDSPAGRDPQVIPASSISAPPAASMSLSTSPSAGRGPDGDDPLKARSARIDANSVGQAVARVGAEEITLAELRYKIREVIRDQGGGDPSVPPAERERQIYQLGASLLNHMIEQRLIVQEAKHHITDQKKLATMTKMIDKAFDDEKLPNLLKRHDAADENELRRKLEEKGQSLDEMRKNFQNDVITQQYLNSKVFSAVRPELPQLEAYYHSHLDDYVAPAQVTFREIVLRFDGVDKKAEARRKAEAILARLRRGEDFAGLAKAESQGSTAEKGGLWEKVVPGGFSPEVNAAVDRQPIRQVGPIIEGPNALRIVRVDARRKAGPLSFEEAQKRVGEALKKELTGAAIEKLIAKLKAKTIIVNEFEEREKLLQQYRASARAGGPGESPGRP